MIKSGQKNVNVFDIINTLSGKRYPSNDGFDDYTANEPYVEYPRDDREHNPLHVINSDQTKPVDGEDIYARIKKIEAEVFSAEVSAESFFSIMSADELKSACETCEKDVKLEADVVVAEPLSVAGSMLMDLNGREIKNEEALYDEKAGKWSLVSVAEGGELVIDGDGSFIAMKDDCYAVDVKGGKCTINSGTFVGNISAAYVTEGTLEINGGRFSIEQKSTYGDDRYLLNCLDASYKAGKASIIVKGGEFVNFDPSNNASEGKGTNYVPEGYKVESVTQDNGDVIYTVVSA